MLLVSPLRTSRLDARMFAKMPIHLFFQQPDRCTIETQIKVFSDAPIRFRKQGPMVRNPESFLCSQLMKVPRVAP